MATSWLVATSVPGRTVPEVDVLLVIAAVYGGLVGSALASFACVVSERAAARRPFMGGRSVCACGRQLKAYENVPVFGWLRVGGKARCCGARIPVRYLVAELVGLCAGGGFGAQMANWVDGGAPGWGLGLAALGFTLVLVAATAALTWPRPGPGTHT